MIFLSFMEAAFAAQRTLAEQRQMRRRFPGRRMVEVLWLDAYGGSLN